MYASRETAHTHTRWLKKRNVGPPEHQIGLIGLFERIGTNTQWMEKKKARMKV